MAFFVHLFLHTTLYTTWRDLTSQYNLDEALAFFPLIAKETCMGRCFKPDLLLNLGVTLLIRFKSVTPIRPS
jgi:hypothetical protein